MNSIHTVSIFIDSSRRDAGNEYSFTTVLPQLISAREILVEKVIVPFSFYVFNSNSNRLIVNWNAAGDVNIDITPGNYSSSTIAAELKTRLDAATATTWTVSYSETTGKFTFVADANDFVFSSTGTANKFLGLDTTANQTSAASTLTAANVASLSGDNYITIKSTALTSGSSVNGSFVDNTFDTTVMRVPVDVNAFGIILDSSNTSIIYSTTKQLKNIDLQLQDADGNDLDLNGCDWSIHLKIHVPAHTH